jgi:hypothetical protein
MFPKILLFPVFLVLPFCLLAQNTFGIRHDRSLRDYEALALQNDIDKPDFGPVVFFTYSTDGSQDQEYVATGTLIHPYWVLTAGHNFYVAEEQSHPRAPFRYLGLYWSRP